MPVVRVMVCYCDWEGLFRVGVFFHCFCVPDKGVEGLLCSVYSTVHSFDCSTSVTDSVYKIYFVWLPCAMTAPVCLLTICTLRKASFLPTLSAAALINMSSPMEAAFKYLKK